MSLLNSLLKKLENPHKKNKIIDPQGDNPSPPPPPAHKTKRTLYTFIGLVIILLFLFFFIAKKRQHRDDLSSPRPPSEQTVTINRPQPVNTAHPSPLVSDTESHHLDKDTTQADNTMPPVTTTLDKSPTDKTTTIPDNTLHATPNTTLPSSPTAMKPTPITVAQATPSAAKTHAIDINIPPLTQHQQLTNQYNQAMTLLHQGQKNPAMATLMSILQQSPTYKNARLSLAALFIRQNKMHRAEQLLQTGLQQHPDDPDYAKLYAHILVQRGSVTQALKLLNQARPTNIDGHIDYFALMASLYMQQQDYKNAESLYRRLVTQAPLNSIWWAGLGISADKLGLTMEAHDALTRANRIGNLPPALQHYINTLLRQ